MVGLELSISVLKVGLWGEATGFPIRFMGDVVARAKREMAIGEFLDGEGGYCVYGALTPAKQSLKAGMFPIGLSHHVKLKNKVPVGNPVCWSDVAYDETDQVVRFRREMEKVYGHK